MLDNYDAGYNIENIPSTYICGICNRIFNERNDFEDHIVSHGTKNSVENSTSEYTLPQAKLSSSKQCEKQEHKYFNCKGCNKQYIDECSFVEHAKNSLQYIYILAYSCSQISLEEYENVYRGEKSYKCDECDQSFGFHFNFIKHKRVIHDKSSFQFEVYNKPFKTIENPEGFSSDESKKLLDASDQNSEEAFESNLNCLGGHSSNESKKILDALNPTPEETFVPNLDCLEVCSSNEHKTLFDASNPGSEETDTPNLDNLEGRSANESKISLNASNPDSEETFITSGYSNQEHKELLVQETIVKKEQQESLHYYTNETLQSRVPFGTKRYKFRCDICNKIYHSTKSLKEHKLIHSGEQPHKCEKCLKTFRFYYNFLRHQHTHEKPSFKCKICPRAYICKDSLRKHFIAQHAPESPDGFKCLLCEKQFSRIHSLWKHYLNHMNINSFKCKICNKSFETKLTLKSHVRIHTDPLCEKAASSPSDENNHFSSTCVAIENPESNEFQCSTCGSSFHDKILLQKHILGNCEVAKTKVPQSGENIKINQVRAGESSSENKQPSKKKKVLVTRQNEKYVHASDVSKQDHKEKGKYVCRICNKSFRAQMPLKEHELIHKGEQPHKCEKCLKTFRHYYNFLRHQLTHDKPSFECKICSKAYTSKDSLKKHFIAQHAHESPDGFKCLLCEKRLSRIRSLWNHYLSHVKIKTFECEVCYKSFETKFTLKSHARIHTDPMCEIDADSPSDEKTHSGSKGVTVENPESDEFYQFQCSTCGRNFQDKILFQKHILGHCKLSKIKVMQSGENIKISQVRAGESCSENKQPSKKKKVLVTRQNEKYVHASDVSKQDHKEKGKYVCGICNKSFRAQMPLNEHELIHKGEQPHKCKKCLKTFRHYYNFLRHQLTHDKPSYECKICSKAYASKDSLNKHFIYQHAPESPDGFKCLLCEKRFSRIHSLWKHYLSHHVNINNFECEVCCKSFETKLALKSHARIHTNPMCERDADSLSDEKTHSGSTGDTVENPESNEFYQFQCSSCGRNFRDKILLQKHILGHCELSKIKVQQSGENIKISQVGAGESCSKNKQPSKKKKSSVIGQNEKYAHTSDVLNKGYKGKYVCHTCKKPFNDQKYLVEHELIHRRQKSNKCKKWPKRFEFYKNFARRLLIHGKLTFKCETCDTIYDTKEALLKHSLSHSSLEIESVNASTNDNSFTSKSIFNNACNNINELVASDKNSDSNPTHIELQTPNCSEGKPQEISFESKSNCEKIINDEYNEKELFFPASDDGFLRNELQAEFEPCYIDKMQEETSQQKIILEVAVKKEPLFFASDDHFITNELQPGSNPCPLNEIHEGTEKIILEAAVKIEDEDSVHHPKSTLDFSFTGQMPTVNLVHPFGNLNHASKSFDNMEFEEKEFLIVSGNSNVGDPLADSNHVSRSSDNMEFQEKEFLIVSSGFNVVQPFPDSNHISRSSDNMEFQEKEFPVDSGSSNIVFSQQHCKEIEKYFCRICNKQFQSKESLAEHEASHIEKPYKCDKCLQSFSSHHRLVRHAFIHGKPSFECRVCNKKLRTKENLRRHMLSNHSDKYKCELCEKTLASKQTLQAHYLIHTGEKPFTCDICYESFVRKPLLKRHEQKHCDVLHNQALTGKPVLANDQSNSKQEGPLFLDNLVCKEKVPNNSNILFSLLNYKKIEKYICSICKKQFQSKKTLAQHEISHNVEKPYKCDKCSRSFSFRHRLVRHAFTHGQPSFECQMCNKKFSTKENLGRHILSNHSDKFKCELCEKILSCKRTLKNHYLTHPEWRETF